MDPNALERIQVPPPPLPVSWGRTVTPYQPAHLRGQPSVYDAMFHDPPSTTPPQASGMDAESGGFDYPEPATHSRAATPAREAFSQQYQVKCIQVALSVALCLDLIF